MEEIEGEPIPFIGGATGIPSNTTPTQIADFIKPEDKVPLILALSLYKQPVQQLENFVMVPDSYKQRTAAWFDSNTGVCIIGLKGTSIGNSKDLSDDTIIAGLGTNYCNLSLVSEGQQLYELLKEQSVQIFFAGHSLGGTAAFCLCMKNPNTYAICLNGGAVATNPVLVGPGPSRATFYHIFGDLISTHMSPNAAEVIRVKKKHDTFGQIWPHDSQRILRSDGAWSYATADEEDVAFLKWGKQFHLHSISPLLSFTAYLLKKNIAETSPIPGSRRFINQQIIKTRPKNTKRPQRK